MKRIIEEKVNKNLRDLAINAGIYNGSDIINLQPHLIFVAPEGSG